MTKYEIMVIAAAALVFVLINIITWTIIAHKERRSGKAPAQVPQSTEVPTVRIPPPMSTEELFVRPKEKRSDFVIQESITFTHTDENL